VKSGIKPVSRRGRHTLTEGEPIMDTNESRSNDNQTEQLTDLEAPDAEEVKGGDSSSNTFYGTGVYKSTDGGKTWTL